MVQAPEFRWLCFFRLQETLNERIVLLLGVPLALRRLCFHWREMKTSSAKVSVRCRLCAMSSLGRATWDKTAWLLLCEHDAQR